MAAPPVKQVREAIDLFNRGEHAKAFERMADDIVLDWSNSLGPHKGIYSGREAALEMLQGFAEAWEAVTWNPQEITALDDAHVLVVNRVRMRGRGSGVEVDATGAQIWTFAGGKPNEVKLYQTKQEALEATGLSDSSSP